MGGMHTEEGMKKGIDGGRGKGGKKGGGKEGRGKEGRGEGRKGGKEGGRKGGGGATVNLPLLLLTEEAEVTIKHREGKVAPISVEG